MTRDLPYWARIGRLGREHIFGVCLVTFDTWHLAILFDLVQGIMLVRQGKVLSPGNEGSIFFFLHESCPPASITQKRPNHGQVRGNEGSMAVIVYVSIFP